MSTLFEDANGNVMAGDRAGGTGGGVTSYVTRAASEAEKTRFHETRVRNAGAAVEVAQLNLKQAQEAHKAHVDALPASTDARLAEEAAARDAEVKQVDDRWVAARVAAEQEDRRDRQVAAAGATPADAPEPFVPSPAMANDAAIRADTNRAATEQEDQRVRQAETQRAQVGAQTASRMQPVPPASPPFTPNPSAGII